MEVQSVVSLLILVIMIGDNLQIGYSDSVKKVNRFAFIERVRRHALNNAGLNTSPGMPILR